MENNCRIYGNRSENKFRLEVHIWEHQSDLLQGRGETPHMPMGTPLGAFWLSFGALDADLGPLCRNLPGSHPGACDYDFLPP